MGIKWCCYIVFCCLAFGGWGQATEEQLKFGLPDSLGEYTLLFGINDMENYASRVHSEYFYYDIYLDTPDDLLLKEGFSLRLRKRVWNDTTVTYSMQLKREMTDSSAVRIEVEEKELDFYRHISHDGRTLYVTELMDRIFEATFTNGAKDEPAAGFSCIQLNDWLHSVVGSPITPFQYLQFFDTAQFSDATLKQLEVKFVGKSQRIRGHVYLSVDNPWGVPLIPAKSQDLPPFFQEHSEAIWLLETSLDFSTFYAVETPGIPIHIREFEVENKYKNAAISTILLNDFSAALQEAFGVFPQQDSKYLQAHTASDY